MKYRGYSLVGAIAFALTGVMYKLVGTSSKLFGKTLFFVFSKAVPQLFRSIFNLFF